MQLRRMSVLLLLGGTISFVSQVHLVCGVHIPSFHVEYMYVYQLLKV